MEGHLPHGNAVQRHSAGDTYPYVLCAHEWGGETAGRVWTVIGPGSAGRCWFPSHNEAVGYARWLKEQRS